MKKFNQMNGILGSIAGFLAFVCTLILSSGTAYAQTENSGSVGIGTDSLSVTKEITTMDYIRPGIYKLKDVKVYGVKYIDAELIINAAGFVRGDEIEIPGDYIASAIRKLWSSRYYSDIVAYVKTEGEDAIIELHMKERPRISRYEFTGIKQGEEKQLREGISIKPHSDLSDYVIHGAENTIKNFYKEKGFLNVDVVVTQKNDTIQSLKNNFVVLTFNVNKGEKMKIKEITFDGNSEIADSKLRGALKNTKEKTFINLLKTAKFDDKKFDEDKLNLIDYYQSKGYRNAIVTYDSIYPISENRIGLKIGVDEGNKYYFRDIKWTGNVKYDTKTLNLLLGIGKGDTYDKKNLTERLGINMESAATGDINVSNIYKNAGHLASQIEPVETVVAGDSIDIDIRIVEGKPFKVNEVTISGNTRTTDRVIRRELRTRPGELYNQELLMSSLRQIQSMGHFTDNINPSIVPVGDDMVDIGFNLEERPNDQFEVSGGWGGGVFVASVGVTFNNVAMRNFLKKDAWRPYPTGDNQKLSIRIQTNGSYYQSYQFSFFEPWLGGKKPNSFSISAHYSAESNGNYFTGERGNASFGTIGVAASYGKRLSWPDPFFTLSGSLSYQAYLLDNWSSFAIQNGTSNIISLSGQLERNSVDHPIYPRSGSQVSMTLSATPPYSYFRSKDFYDDPNLSNDKAYKFVEYYQITASSKWYLSMLSNNKLVMMAAAEIGYLGHYTNKPKAISIFEGYSMGGDGISGYSIYGINNIGLRGYENEALTPFASRGLQARVYNKFTFEMRYPIIMEASTQIFGLVFAEGGNAFMGWREYNPFNLKKSAGFGLRLFLPVVGMFGIDWGYGFDKAPLADKRSGSQFHFSIGRQF